MKQQYTYHPLMITTKKEKYQKEKGYTLDDDTSSKELN